MHARQSASLGILALLSMLVISCGDDAFNLEPVASVSVSGPSHVLEPSQTLQLVALVSDGEGNPLSGRRIEWNSSDTSVASVDQNGLVTGHSIGSVEIEARCEGVDGSFGLSVARVFHSSMVRDTAGPDGVVGVHTDTGGGLDYRFKMLKPDGSGFGGATLAYAEIDSLAIIILNGDKTDWVPSFFFGTHKGIQEYLSSEFNAWSGVPVLTAGPQLFPFTLLFFAISVVAVSTVTVDYTLNIMEISNHYWEIMKNDMCASYMEIADLMKLRTEQRINEAKVILSFLTAGAGGGSISVLGDALILGSDFLGAASLDMAGAIVAQAIERGVGDGHDPSTRVRVQFDELDPEEFGAAYKYFYLGFNIYPDDPYCSGSYAESMYDVSGLLVGENGSSVRPRVQVKNHFNEPVEGAFVNFWPGQGSGSITSAGLMATDVNGIAEASWDLPDTQGNWIAFAGTDRQDKSGHVTGTLQVEFSASTFPPILVTTESLPDGEERIPYDFTLTAEGGNGTYSWAIRDGDLPDGLALQSHSGRITGTPNADGTFPITFKVNSGGLSAFSPPLEIRIEPFQCPSICVDGEWTPGEWDDAATWSASLDPNDPFSPYDAQLTLRVANDSDSLYISAEYEIPDEANYSSGGLQIYLSKGSAFSYDGPLDIIGVTDVSLIGFTIVFDKWRAAGGEEGNDTDLGGTNDVIAARNSYPGAFTHYFLEIATPLRSTDVFDHYLLPGDVVSFKVRPSLLTIHNGFMFKWTTLIPDPAPSYVIR